MSKIKITKTEKIDSRQPGFKFDRQSFISGTKIHARDVAKLVKLVTDMAIDKVRKHDGTKVTGAVGFEKATMSKEFKKSPGGQTHLTKEDHHVVDAIAAGNTNVYWGDVLEMAADWIAAGKARSLDGKFDVRFTTKGENDNELKDALYLAFMNTLKFLDENSEVIEPTAGRTTDVETAVKNEGIPHTEKPKETDNGTV